MIKYLPLILFAMCIDGLQALLSFVFLAMGSALTAATPVGGAAAGCAIGYVASSNIASGAVNCVIAGAAGAVGSVAGAPLGIALGIASDICISVTLGIILVMTLSFFGMFYPAQLLCGSLFEFLPGLDALPGWTAMTVVCVLRKRKEEGKLLGSASSAFGSFLSSKTPIGRMYKGIQSVQQKNVAMVRTARGAGGRQINDSLIRARRVHTRQQLKRNLTNIDGITPAPKDSSAARTKTQYAI